MVMAPIWLALALAAPQQAQPVTVEIVAIGHSETPADKFQLAALLTVSADSDVAASALLAKRVQELTDKVRATGAQIDVRSGSQFELFASDPSLAMTLIGAPDVSGAGGKKSASAIAVIIAPDSATVVRAGAAAATVTGVKTAGEPTSLLTDPAAARRTAKSDGLTKARVEADAYAAKLGLGGVTLIAVSEKMDFGAVMLSSYASGGKQPAFGPLQRSTGNTVLTDVPLTVTYRIDPK